jgi:hypothetical protein
MFHIPSFLAHTNIHDQHIYIYIWTTQARTKLLHALPCLPRQECNSPPLQSLEPIFTKPNSSSSRKKSSHQCLWTYQLWLHIGYNFDSMKRLEPISLVHSHVSVMQQRFQIFFLIYIYAVFYIRLQWAVPQEMFCSLFVHQAAVGCPTGYNKCVTVFFSFCICTNILLNFVFGVAVAIKPLPFISSALAQIKF